MIRVPFVVSLVLAVSACAATQINQAQTVAAGYQEKIKAACDVAMLVAPAAPAIAPWIIGGCATEAAIAKLALDPSSLEWVDGLIEKAGSTL